MPPARAKLVLALAVSTAALAGALTAFLVLDSSPKSSTGALDTCLTRPEGPARTSCFETAFREAAAEDAVEPTLNGLEKLWKRGALDDCHLLAHEFGHVVVASSGSLDRALTAGGLQCRQGYMHGAVEAAVGGAGVPAGRLHTNGPGTCANQREPIPNLACFHGLGHAYMWITGHNVERSISRCGATVPSARLQQCESGVLMENTLQYAAGSDAAFAARAARSCDDVSLSPKHTEWCYSMIGQVSMMALDMDLRRARSVCDRIVATAGERTCKRAVRGTREEVLRTLEGLPS